MLQSESMSKLMGQYFEIEVTSDQGIAPVLSHLHPSARTKPTIKSDLISAIVKDDEINVRIDIKCPLDLDCNTKCTIKIVAIGAIPIHPVNQWLPLRIGFKTECFISIPVRTHLFGIKSLNLPNHCFHRINYTASIRPVIRQKVDHPHREGFANVQICSPPGGGNAPTTLPLLDIDWQTEMHGVGRTGCLYDRLR